MIRLVTAFAITSTLLLAQSCSFSSSSEEKPIAGATKQHEGHLMGNEGTHNSAQSHTHGGHSMGDGENLEQAEAKLTEPKNITPNTAVMLAIDIQNSDGIIANFDTFQEKLMHLIAVSDDLQFFSHLHPTYKQNGRFEVEASFPKAGGYTLFSDYKPSGKTEQVSVMKTRVIGNTPTAPAINLNRTKIFGNTKVNLTLDQSGLKAGEEVMLAFDLREAASNQPVKDLQPYLGERGHLVIIKQSSPLTKVDYIHAHAHGMENNPPGEVHFMTNFPKAGKYKLWGQFNRNGRIVTADFWVNVE